MSARGALRLYGRFAVRVAFGTHVIACGLLPSSSAADRLVGSVKQFNEAVNAARPGDSIILRNGEWRDARLVFTGEGSAESPITLRAETSGKVVITGASQLRVGGRRLMVSGLHFREAYDDDHLIAFRKDSKQLAEDCRLTDCVIENCNHPTDSGETRWISLYGRRNRVDHCSISGKTGKGTTLVAFIGEQPNEHRIDHNFFGPRKKVGKNGGETIRIGDSDTAHLSSKTVVEDNRFVECDGEAEIISNKSCDNVYRRNTFVRCSGALTLRHGHRCLVQGNIFLGQRARGTGGVRIIGEGHRVVNNYFSDLEGDDHRAALCLMNGMADSPANGYSPVKEAVVAFNTFVNCKETFVVGLADGDESTIPPADCTIANNLIVSKRPTVLLCHQPIGFRWANNLVEGDAGASIEGVREVKEIKLQRSGDLRRLLRDSPAIDAAGDESYGVTQDLFAEERDAHPDVGCEEFSRRSSKRAALELSEVGASWSRRSSEKQPTAD